MEQRKQARPSTALKRAVMARFAGSGLTVDAFCQRESISASSFYRWRSLHDNSPTREVMPHVAAKMPNKAPAFVDLGSLRSAHAPLELRLDLGGGVLLHLVRG